MTRATSVRMSRCTIELKSSLQEECAICMNSMQNRRVYHLPCGHSFHLLCTIRWRDGTQAMNRHCPICRAEFMPASVLMLSPEEELYLTLHARYILRIARPPFSILLDGTHGYLNEFSDVSGVNSIAEVPRLRAEAL